jgi:hypothetical protein
MNPTRNHYSDFLLEQAALQSLQAEAGQALPVAMVAGPQAALAGHRDGGDNERLFSIDDEATGEVRWYFRTREGVMGPFESRALALMELTQFKARCREAGNQGNRERRKSPRHRPNA